MERWKGRPSIKFIDAIPVCVSEGEHFNAKKVADQKDT